MKLKTPMEILNLLIKSDSNHVNLTVHERAVLSVIISFVNGENLAKDGYKAWPSTDTIICKSGIGESTIERSIVKLVKEGWISKESGKGKGSSNTYYVNADKIVQAAALSGVKASDRVTGKTVVAEPVELHKRNTGGLVQNKSSKPVATPQSAFSQQYYGTWYYSQEELDKARIAREAEQRRLRELEDDEDVPF